MDLEGTIDNIINLSKDTELMKAIDNYVGGKIDETSPIFKKLAKKEQGIFLMLICNLEEF